MTKSATTNPPASSGDTHVELIRTLHAAAKTSAAYGKNHNATTHALDLLERAVVETGVPCRVQFVCGCAFVDKQLVPVGHRDFPKVASLVEAADRLAAQEIEFAVAPERSELTDFVAIVGLALSVGDASLDDLVLQSIRTREIAATTLGADGEVLDPELFAVTQTALALQAGVVAYEELQATKAWPWAAGLQVIRHVEKAVLADPDASLRALELTAAQWDEPRCGVSAARALTQVLAALDLPAPLRRAIAHAGLGLLLCAKLPADTALTAADHFSRAARASLDADSEVSAHRLRVLAGTAALRGSVNDGLRTVALALTTVYDLEQIRRRSAFPPARVELLAHGLEQFDPAWMRMLVQCEGALPPGSRVQLHDGRMGVVVGVGDGAAPWRPKVLVGREVLQPARDVHLAEVMT